MNASKVTYEIAGTRGALTVTWSDVEDEMLARIHADAGAEIERRKQEATRRAFAVSGFLLGGSPVGTSAQGYMYASYKDLVAILGEPNVDNTDGYKVSTEWHITLADGRVATIYDYKETELYDKNLPSVAEFRALPKYGWHIGGKGGGPSLVEAVKAVLSSEVA